VKEFGKPTGFADQAYAFLARIASKTLGLIKIMRARENSFGRSRTSRGNIGFC
jgi:hypothetical protein